MKKQSVITSPMENCEPVLGCNERLLLFKTFSIEMHKATKYRRHTGLGLACSLELWYPGIPRRFPLNYPRPPFNPGIHTRITIR